MSEKADMKQMVRVYLAFYTEKNKHNLQTFPLEEAAWPWWSYVSWYLLNVLRNGWTLIQPLFLVAAHFKFNRLIKYLRKRWTSVWLFNYCWLKTGSHIVQMQIIYANRAATSMWMCLEWINLTDRGCLMKWQVIWRGMEFANKVNSSSK